MTRKKFCNLKIQNILTCQHKRSMMLVNYFKG